MFAMHGTRSCALLVGALGAMVLPLAVHGQAYPFKPIRTIMTVSGGMDLVARLVAEGVRERLGQPMVVESQSGAGGAIGAEMVARASSDGYTIALAGPQTLIVRKYLAKNTSYDAVRDFAPIAQVAETTAIIVAHPGLPVDSLGGLIEYARRNPGKVSFGTSGIGTSHHFSAEAIRLLSGIEWVHVPYKSAAPVLTDLIAGRTQVGFTILATYMPYINSGKMKILAVNAGKRTPILPDVPTVAEQLPGYDRPPSWNAYFGPAGLPQALVRRLHDTIVSTVQQSEVRAKVQAAGVTVITAGPEELGEMVVRDTAAVGKLVKMLGIQPE